MRQDGSMQLPAEISRFKSSLFSIYSLCDQHGIESLVVWPSGKNLNEWKVNCSVESGMCVEKSTKTCYQQDHYGI